MKEFKDIALNSFSDIIANCNIIELKRLIDNNLSLIKQPYSKTAIKYILYFKKMPLIGEYLKKNLDFEPNSVLKLIKSKNIYVYNLMITEKGRKWFYIQHKTFMDLIK